MSKVQSYSLLVIYFCLVHALSIYLFTDGFFLTRYELTQQSQCKPFNSTENAIRGENNENTVENHVDSARNKQQRGCWNTAEYDRAIILLIDALRFDFIYYNHSMD